MRQNVGWMVQCHAINNRNKLDKIMYNFQLNTKKRAEQATQAQKSQSVQKFLNNYYETKQPQLLNNYNKRINDFIRRIEYEPIVIKADPYQSSTETGGKDREGKAKYQARRLSVKSSMAGKVGDEDGRRSFKYKDCEDWTSLYTPWERLERQKNYEVFKNKYGDPSIAFRSIGSQSQYHPLHEYRQRNQNLQINPPMKYTNKPSKHAFIQIRNKKQKERDLKEAGVNKTLDLKGTQQWDKHAMTSSAAHSTLGNDEIFSNQLLTGQSGNESKNKQSQDEYSSKHTKTGLQKSYFKQIIDIQQKLQDEKSKKFLKTILQRCGVYRKKNRRAVTDNDVDQFQKLQASNQG